VILWMFTYSYIQNMLSFSKVLCQSALRPLRYETLWQCFSLWENFTKNKILVIAKHCLPWVTSLFCCYARPFSEHHNPTGYRNICLSVCSRENAISVKGKLQDISKACDVLYHTFRSKFRRCATVYITVLSFYYIGLCSALKSRVWDPMRWMNYLNLTDLYCTGHAVA
jgi:hypothetical protein